MVSTDYYEYELLDIEWELNYDLDDASSSRYVVKDSSDEMESSTSVIEYDENGIPMGNTPKESMIRKKIIFDFYEVWKNSHPDKAVYNKSLQSNVLIRKESVVEAAGHAARSYHSTLAVLRLNELLSEATYVATDKVKSGNKNQSKLIRMILMQYQFQDIGLIKLTIGVRNRTLDKIQYGISAIDASQEIVPKVKAANKKKAPHKK